MNRTERAETTVNELFGTGSSEPADPDPEFTEIGHRFIYGEIFHQGNLDLRLRLLISLVVLTTIRNLSLLPSLVGAALTVGVQPREIKEALYQCAPFIGFPILADALDVVNTALLDKCVGLPLERAGTVTEGERFAKGQAIQGPIYGDRIRENLACLPGEHGTSLPTFLTELCFGDFYTRDGLDLATRELLILCLLCALGDTNVQIRSHAAGARKVGNSPETILSAVTQCLPWIGFPKTLNAITILRDVLL